MRGNAIFLNIPLGGDNVKVHIVYWKMLLKLQNLFVEIWIENLK